MKRMDSSSSLISTSASISTSISTLISSELIKNEPIPQNECSNEALPSVATTEVSSPVLQQMQPIEEMLGSVTTYNNLEGADASGNAKNCQQVRSSARVFKKMKLENAQALTIIPSIDKDKKDISDKIEVKRSFRPQWSPEDKDAFFEALNEYGKDFDAIQQHIINKFKKKSLPESLKTKEQIRHFYYRTWQKISKHLKFSEDIKKIAQELYALINFGEFRKKVGSVSEKTCLKLNELIYRGTVAIRIKGKTIRIKTPMCRALRKLNQLDEKHEDLKLPTRVLVELRPKNVETWINVQFMSQNPRVRVSLPLQRRLSALLQCLNDRWKTQQTRTHEKVHSYTTSVLNDNQPCTSSSNGIALSPQLRLAPKTNCSVAMPAINLSEYLTSHRICLNAYEERIGVKVPGEKLWKAMFIGFRSVGRAKNRGIKRQRNDSAGDKNTKIKENCDEQDSDTPMTVSDVVDSAINTILSLQKQESDIDSDVASSAAPLSAPTTPQKEEIKIEPNAETPAPFSPCRKEEISKIKNGWTLDDCGSLTIGEMYLMFGHDSKLELEYSWDAPEMKCEPLDPMETSNETSFSDNREMNDIKEAPPPTPPSNEISVTLKKLLSLAKLHYRKERIKCPCGHVCGGPKATTANRTKSMVMKTNQRATIENASTTITTTTTAAGTTTTTAAAAATQDTIIRSVAPIIRAPQINRKVNINPEPTFRTPTIYPSNGAPTDTFRAQLDSLQRMRPKYTNRKGRPVRSKHVVVERMLPLLPKPLINGHSIVAMKVISQTDQLRPIAPRIDESTTSTSTSSLHTNTNNNLNNTIDTEIKRNSDNVTNGNSNNNKFESTASFFRSSSEARTTPPPHEDEQQQRVTCTSPTSISNFLDLDIPTADTNDLILQHSVAGAKENLTSFAGLLSDEMPDTTPMSSPSRLLKENDNQWLNSEVHDYSLTSLLGHLESPMKTTTPAIIPCDDTPISQDIDAQFPSLLGENGVDFVDQFVDMAAQVDTVNSEIEQ